MAKPLIATGTPALLHAEAGREHSGRSLHPELTSFVTSDESLFILRRFSRLSARILLALQDEIVQLENKLDEIDRLPAHPTSASMSNSTLKNDTDQDRRGYMKEAEEKLKRYYELVHQQAELFSRPKVDKGDLENVRNWFLSRPTVTSPPETNYANDRDDLFAMSHVRKPPILRLLERSSKFRKCRIWRKRSKILDHRIINTVVGLAMLIVPLWVLAFVKNKVKRLATITVCLVCFLCVLNFTMVPRPAEVFAATAAYAAVLVVFLQVAT